MISALDRFHRFDASLLASIRSRQTPWVNRLMTMLTRAGDPQSWVVHCSVLALAAGAASYRLPVLMAAGALSATLVSQILKRLFRRQRPNDGIPGFVAVVEDPDAFSFPSGHTAVAFGAAAALAGAHAPLGVAECIVAMAIGCSRVYLGAHYPADVVAGAIVGISAGSAAFAAVMPVLR
jgi:undecaprenyl-diphosphatase